MIRKITEGWCSPHTIIALLSLILAGVGAIGGATVWVITEGVGFGRSQQQLTDAVTALAAEYRTTVTEMKAQTQSVRMETAAALRDAESRRDAEAAETRGRINGLTGRIDTLLDGGGRRRGGRLEQQEDPPG